MRTSLQKRGTQSMVAPPAPTHLALHWHPHPSPQQTITHHLSPITHLTATPPHRPTSLPAQPLAAHHDSHTDTPKIAINKSQNTSPHTPSMAARHTHTNQHLPHAHIPTTTTWPSTLTVATSAHTYYTIHTTAPEQPITKPPMYRNPKNTCTCTHTPPHTSQIQPYKRHKRPLPLKPLSLDT